MGDRHFIYVIGHKHQLRYPYNECYIYYGNNLIVEWNRCSNGDTKVGRAIRMYHLNFDENYMVIFFGSEAQCREKYKELRPHSGMGLNDDYDEEHFKKKPMKWQKPEKKPYEMTRAE